MAWFGIVDESFIGSLTPKQLWAAGVLHAEDLFIKPEMHPRNKTDDKRWRNIWNCSAQQELTMRLFHDRQNKVKISAYQAGLTHSADCPTFGSCPGIGHHDEGISAMCDAMKRLESVGQGARSRNLSG